MKLDSDKAAEIAASHAQQFNTKRPTVPALEEKMFTPIQCLDHGFVRLADPGRVPIHPCLGTKYASHVG